MQWWQRHKNIFRLTVSARNKQRMSREMADFLYSRAVWFWFYVGCKSLDPCATIPSNDPMLTALLRIPPILARTRTTCGDQRWMISWRLRKPPADEPSKPTRRNSGAMPMPPPRPNRSSRLSKRWTQLCCPPARPLVGVLRTSAVVARLERVKKDA